MNFDSMDIMNKERYGFVNPKTELTKFKWTIYKYYKLYIEEKEIGRMEGPHWDNSYRIRYLDYTDYLDRNVSRFRFLRDIKSELSDTYQRRVDDFHDRHYHPDNVNELVSQGYTFSQAINTLDKDIQAWKEYY